MMKKLLTFVVAAPIFLLASPAHADTVRIVTETKFSSPADVKPQQSSFEIPFRGPQTITFTVAGKTCNLNGSARGSVPMGCNYTITIKPNGTLRGELREGNSVCTQSPQVASSCR